jgi:hypothetical protein
MRREAFLKAVQLQRLGWDFRSFFWLIIDSPDYYLTN